MSSSTKGKSATIKKDVVAGIIVFLIALPLCLGIAQASGAPLFSGIIAGIVGGIIIGFFSKSSLSVSGPAAGLVAIVISALASLGSFPVFLCSVMIAGALQFVLGMVKAGSIANYFPINVIEGMLAGIGLTIIIKQIPDAVGFVRANFEAGIDGAEDGFNMTTILRALEHIELGAVIIAVTGILIMAMWQTPLFKKLKMVPSALIVVVLGTLLNQLFKQFLPAYYLDPTHLVALPVASSIPEFLGQFSFPELSGFARFDVWQTGVIIAVVASIETLLCIEATDKLDPQKRFTPGNSELKAQGIGNLVSGLIGGLPITSVIVRSSANVYAGAQSKFSAIFHGVLLLVCAATIPFILNLIPKASLAAILIFTGYRLCNPKVIKHVWKDGGLSQFLPFAVTAIAVVSLDLLKGVGLGLVFSILYLLRQNLRLPYYFHRSVYQDTETIKLQLAQEVSFLNKASIKETLQKLPANSKVIIDASESEYIDYDVLTLIKEFTSSQAPERGIKISLVGFRNIYGMKNEDLTDTDIIPASVESTPKSFSGGYKKLIKQLSDKQKEDSL